MSDELLRLRDKVQRILVSRLQVGLDSDGDFTVDYDSARAYVRCYEQPSRRIVKVEAPVLFRVQPSPELFKYVALHSNDYIFGHLSAAEHDDGSVLLLFTHQLLGDYLDEEELFNAVAAVVTASNSLDDELKEKFGGERFADL